MKLPNVSSVLSLFKKLSKSKIGATAKKEIKKIDVQKTVKSSVKKSVVKGASKKISSFYSSKNFKKVEKLLVQDGESLTRKFGAASSVEQVSSLRTRARQFQASAGGSSALQDLSGLNFFSIYKEVRTQELLISKFSISLGKVELARSKALRSEIDSFKSRVESVYLQNGVHSYFQENISKIDSQVLAHGEAYSLVK
jgi:hypothetical protein